MYARKELNLLPMSYQDTALPMSYSRILCATWESNPENFVSKTNMYANSISGAFFNSERNEGIEPSPSVWKTAAHPSTLISPLYA